MATRYEYHTTNENTTNWYQGTTWGFMSFTPSTAHKITYVVLKIFRDGSPGDITVSIRATDGGGLPTGGDLGDVGTTSGNTLPDTPAEWRTITLGNYNLDASTKYAIVLRAVGGDGSNALGWRTDGTVKGYAEGHSGLSVDSGVGWSGNDADRDHIFEEWGTIGSIAGGSPLAQMIQAGLV